MEHEVGGLVSPLRGYLVSEPWVGCRLATD